MNSRLNISNEAVMQTIERLALVATETGTRALLVWPDSDRGTLKRLAMHYDCEFVDAESAADRADRITSLLGSERNMAVVLLAPAPDIGLLAALAGTVCAGGVLVVGTVSFSTDDEANQNHSTKPAKSSACSHSTARLHRLVQRFAKLFPDAIVLASNASEDKKPLDLPTYPHTSSPLQQAIRSAQKPFAGSSARAEQEALLEQADRHLSGLTTGSILISGRRGRGKSTLMARIASSLIDAQKSFRITALNESALASYAQHIGPVGKRFISPEQAVKSKTDILLVDEAASFSLQTLQHFARNCHHLILCTTTEGYEASGRAVDVRLLSELNRRAPTLLHLQPTYSWRWNHDDPLEQFVDALLLGNGASYQPDSFLDNYTSLADAAKNCRIRQITQQQLTSDEQLLKQVHGLLSATHYQTTTKDLEHLLDAPSLTCWVQMLEDNVVGLLLLEEEGQIPASLHSAVVSKQRRLKNQLLPQLLAQMADSGQALHLRYGRVVRLAVIPRLRRHGLASALVSKVITTNLLINEADNQSSPTPYDALGASFASDASSLAFWLHQGFTEFHRGFRANPRSGKHAAAVLRSSEPLTSAVLSQAVCIHNDNTEARKNKPEDRSTYEALSSLDRQILARFANGHRSLHDSFAAVKRLVNNTDGSAIQDAGISRKQYELELRAYVQQSIPKH